MPAVPKLAGGGAGAAAGGRPVVEEAAAPWLEAAPWLMSPCPFVDGKPSSGPFCSKCHFIKSKRMADVNNNAASVTGQT